MSQRGRFRPLSRAFYLGPQGAPVLCHKWLRFPFLIAQEANVPTHSPRTLKSQTTRNLILSLLLHRLLRSKKTIKHTNKTTTFLQWSIAEYTNHTPCPRVVGQHKTNSMSYCACDFCLGLVFFLSYCFSFFPLFLFVLFWLGLLLLVCFLWQGFSVDQAVLKLRLTCLCFLNAGIKVSHHHPIL